MKSAKIVFFILLSFFVCLLITIMVQATQYSSQFSISKFEAYMNATLDSISQSVSLPTPTPSLFPPPNPSFTPPTINPKPSPFPTPSPHPSPKPSQPKSSAKSSIPKSCTRALVIHHDGSTSNRCYLPSDASQINQARSQYQSAQTFYQFHLDGVIRYEEEYKRTGSSIYLDAKSRAQSSADQEKQKIDQAIAQMQNIEAKGW